MSHALIEAHVVSAAEASMDARIEEAVAPYAALLSPVALESMRAVLRAALHENRVLSELVRDLAPRPQVAESGDITRPEAHSLADEVVGVTRRR